MSYENEVFDATVSDYVKDTLDDWGDLGKSVADTVAAIEATEISIRIEITLNSPDGKAEFSRRTGTILWRSPEQLAALEAELDEV